jgi:hypothetical protein
MAEEQGDGRVRLYRAYDSQRRLLYVGISLCALTRLANHRSQSEWFGEVSRLEIEVFPNRRTAEDAERRAIWAEGPVYNRQGLHVPTGDDRKMVPELRYFPVKDAADPGEWGNNIIGRREDWS